MYFQLIVIIIDLFYCIYYVVDVWYSLQCNSKYCELPVQCKSCGELQAFYSRQISWNLCLPCLSQVVNKCRTKTCDKVILTISDSFDTPILLQRCVVNLVSV